MTSVYNLFPEIDEPDLPESKVLDCSMMGLSAEFLACSVVAGFGFMAHHINAKGYDFVVECKERLMRVQAKSTAKADKGIYSFSTTYEISDNIRRAGGKRKTAGLTLAQCDVLAFIAADLRKVIFLPVGDGSKSIRINQSEFLAPDSERLSWLNVMDKF